MPENYKAPGVYVEETASGVKSIERVSTSVTAFVGNACFGKENKAVKVISFLEYKEEFKGLCEASELSYAVHQFFLNGGITAWIVNTGNRAVVFKDSEGDERLLLILKNRLDFGNGYKINLTVNMENSSFSIDIIPDNGAAESYPAIEMDNIKELLKDSQNFSAEIINKEKNTMPVSGTLEIKGGDIESFMGTPENHTGIHALEDIPSFNLLCLPGISDKDILSAAESCCRKRRAFLIIDPPENIKTCQDIKSYVADSGNLPVSENAALYFPWVIINDPLTGNDRLSAPCGTIAGIYSRTDAQRGVWKAPAGNEALCKGAAGLSVILTDEEQGELNKLGINCIRKLPAAGIVIWGARTLKGSDALASEYKFIPVRRTALFIEESLYTGLQWVVFEPNDEPLWSKIRMNVNLFMINLFRSGTFQGALPNEAYFVKCDAGTTTANYRIAGVVNISVGFAPLKPAEFVVIKISMKTAVPV